MGETNRRRETSISKVSSYVEIGEFWDEHDLNDYWGKTTKVKIDVVLEPEATYYSIQKISPKSSSPLQWIGKEFVMKYFDYRSVAREAKIPDQKLRKLVDLIGKEFPSDPMMAELHALRACLAIRDGHIQIDDALKLQAESRV